MTTTGDLIEWTKAHLLGNSRQEQNTLNGAYTAGGTSMTFTYAMGGIAKDAYVQVDFEVLRVMAVSGQTATVLGAQLGSTAANHADGSLVTVNPRFYDHLILDDLNHDLDDLSGEGLFQEKSLNVAYNSAQSGYDLTGATNVMEILEVRYKEPGPAKRFPLISSWSLLRDMDTADFPSGFALVLDRPGWPGLNLRIRYAAEFGQLTTTRTEDVTTVTGLPSTAHDLPPMGAAIRQMMGREIKRSFLEAQPDTRRASEVPPGTAQASIRTLMAQRKEGVNQELGRLLQRYPIRSFR